MAPTAELLKGPPAQYERGAQRRGQGVYLYSCSSSSLRYARIYGDSALRSRFDAHSAVRFALEMTQAL